MHTLLVKFLISILSKVVSKKIITKIERLPIQVQKLWISVAIVLLVIYLLFTLDNSPVKNIWKESSSPAAVSTVIADDHSTTNVTTVITGDHNTVDARRDKKR